MPQHYTVPTSNAFAALDDSDNEDAILSKPEEIPEPPKAARAPVDSKRPPRTNANQTQTRSAPRTARRPDTPERDSPAAGTEERPRPTGVARPTGPRPAGRGGRFQRPQRPGEREFDRHSGTGRGKEMKKGGGGAHNWGNEPNDFGGDDVQAAEWPAATVVEGAEGQEAAAAPAAGGEEQPKAAPEEEKPKTQSYADYLASKQEQQAALPVREAAADTLEEDRKKYIEDGYQIYTKENPRAMAEKEAQGDSGDEKQRPRTMHLAEVAEQSGQQLNYRAQRGGRGGRNNGPQRANSKPQQQQGSAVPSKEINLSDNQAFPTLQAH